MTNTATTAPKFHPADMTEHEQANPRFAELRTIAGLGTSGAYSVHSVSTLTGHYNTVGQTDDIALACEAAAMLEAHAVPCETFQARKTMGNFR